MTKFRGKRRAMLSKLKLKTKLWFVGYVTRNSIKRVCRDWWWCRDCDTPWPIKTDILWCFSYLLLPRRLFIVVIVVWLIVESLLYRHCRLRRSVNVHSCACTAQHQRLCSLRVFTVLFYCLVLLFWLSKQSISARCELSMAMRWVFLSFGTYFFCVIGTTMWMRITRIC